jgi:predicted MFS family arabinose efflux permease
MGGRRNSGLNHEAATRKAFAESLKLLRTRRFGTFWFASLLSSVGTWAQQVAEPWLLLTLGASSFLVGLDSFAMSAPIWVLTLPGGVLADHADRRRVIAGFQSIQMLCPIVIVAMLLAGVAHPWAIIVLSLVVGITDALSMPSFSSIVPSIVTHEQIPAGLALNSTQFNVSRIVGPAIAGVLMATVGAIGCFVVSAVSYVPFIGIAIWILPRQMRPRPGPRPPTGQHPFADLGTVLSDAGLRGALLTALASGVLCGPLITFCPVLVKNLWHGSAAQFSVAIGAFGIGGLLGGVGLLGVDPARDRRAICAAFAVLYGVLIIGISLDPWAPVLPLLFVVAGVAMSVTNTSANTYVQSAAAANLRGQAVSLYMLASRGGTALGALATGLSVGIFGIRDALVINGALAVVAQLLIMRMWSRQSNRRDSGRPG